MSREPTYKYPSKKANKEMTRRILHLLHKDGLKDAFIIKGLGGVSIQIDVPHKKDFISFEVTIS